MVSGFANFFRFLNYSEAHEFSGFWKFGGLFTIDHSPLTMTIDHSRLKVSLILFHHTFRRNNLAVGYWPNQMSGGIEVESFVLWLRFIIHFPIIGARLCVVFYKTAVRAKDAVNNRCAALIFP